MSGTAVSSMNMCRTCWGDGRVPGSDGWGSEECPSCEGSGANVRIVPTAAQERQRATAMMATDAMTGLDFGPLCDVIEAHITARPDIDADRLHSLANILSRTADHPNRGVL